MPRCVVIGIDSLPPEIVFDRPDFPLPRIRSLMERGVHGRLQSTVPPITVPAWVSLTTGRSPGALGLYGFHNRPDHGYSDLVVADGTWVTEPRIWDLLGARGMGSIVIGVPLTHPLRPLRGIAVAGPPLPDPARPPVWPEGLREEYPDLMRGYVADIEDYRMLAKDVLLERVSSMTRRRFELAREWMRERPWDFFMVVEMGLDRIHHAMWNEIEEGGRAVRQYYALLDGLVGQLVEEARDAAVLIVSDHGATSMGGGICLNQWLLDQGYLVMRESPRGVMQLRAEAIDWTRTRAWGAGGYVGRVFINLQGREPMGIVPPAEHDSLREEIIAGLATVHDGHGRRIAVRAFRPELTYPVCRGAPPDLIIYFSNLSLRAIGTVGHADHFSPTNDLGPDQANHSEDGVFILRDPATEERGRRDGLNIIDVAPTVLRVMSVEIPAEMEGKPLGPGQRDTAAPPGKRPERPRRAEDTEPGSPAAGPWTDDERGRVEDQLRDLGYL